MKILAVDTSTTVGSVALLDGLQIAAEWTLHSRQTHNRRLLGTIDLLLQQAGWPVGQVDAFAVTIGPGSFTGLRIGLTTVKTLAWSLDRPYVGVSSLEALAAPFEFAQRPLCTVLDARKKEVYYALYRPAGQGGLTPQGPPQAAPPERVTEHIQEPTLFCGDGWLLYEALFRKRLGSRALPTPAPYHTIRAGFVAELARRKLTAGAVDDPLTSAPCYIRPSEAELHNPQLTPQNR